MFPCSDTIYNSILVALLSGLIASLCTYWIMRSNQKHLYGQCLYKEKIELFRSLFVALNELLKALDLPDGDDKLKNVQAKVNELKYIATVNSATVPRDVISICCGFALVTNQAKNFEEIEDLLYEINLYKLLLMLARREMSADKLSSTILRRLSEFRFNQKISVSYKDKDIDKDVANAITLLKEKFIQNYGQGPQ